MKKMEDQIRRYERMKGRAHEGTNLRRSIYSLCNSVFSRNGKSTVVKNERLKDGLIDGNEINK